MVATQTKENAPAKKHMRDSYCNCNSNHNHNRIRASICDSITKHSNKQTPAEEMENLLFFRLFVKHTVHFNQPNNQQGDTNKYN